MLKNAELTAACSTNDASGAVWKSANRFMGQALIELERNPSCSDTVERLRPYADAVAQQVKISRYQPQPTQSV
jgi:hypothetical protein